MMEELVKFSNDLVTGHKRFWKSTKSTTSPSEICWRKKGFNLHVIGEDEVLELVMRLFEGSRSGEDSLDETLIMLVRAIFFGGFLVEDETLEAILKVD
ncbi:hypothetical protein Tco_0446886 [Tanacetum coccineum]